jgi:hypothetical protein
MAPFVPDINPKGATSHVMMAFWRGQSAATAGCFAKSGQAGAGPSPFAGSGSCRSKKLASSLNLRPSGSGAEKLLILLVTSAFIRNTGS